MSRSRKRNANVAINRVWDEGGRAPVIRKEPDCRVSHSHDCWMCERGTAPKRVMHIKPRRRAESRELAQIIREET